MRKARPGEPTEPQWIQGVPDETYFSWQHLTSQSTLKIVRKLTPRDAYNDLLKGSESTPAKEKGTALHIALLQPELFEDRVACGLGIDRKSNANKAKHEAHGLKHAGKIILKAPDFENCHAAIEIIKGHPLAMSLLEMDGVQKELAGVFLDAESGALCKFKLDLCGYWRAEGGHNVIVDIKTTSCDMSDDALERDIGKFGYDVQAAFYTHGTTVLSPLKGDDAWRFMLIFVNPERGTVRVIEPLPDAVEDGRIKYRGPLNKWAKCCKSGDFPGWPGKITRLSLKPWDRVSDFELDQQLAEATAK